jgi:hypothetical protein
MKTAIRLLCCLALFASGCGFKSGDGQGAQSSPTQPPTGSPNAATATSTASPGLSSATSTAGLDVCSLIEKSEIASVQGAPVQSVVPNAQTIGGLASSQCYFMINSADGTKNLSVHLQVTQVDPAGSNPKAVKDYWERSFHKEKTKRKERSKGKEGDQPQPIPGVGEEAFWVGNNKMGVLYALKKDKFIRVSIGGPDNPKSRLDKSKTLMAKALERVS